MTKPQQLAPTVGLSHDGFKFLEGNFEGLKGYAMGRTTKSHRGKLYIDDAGWGPEASSIKYGYRVPFGGIHVFIGKIGEPGPEPDICTDLVEMTQRARSARVKPDMKHALVGVIHGVESEDRSESGGETVVYSGTSHRPERPSRYISYKMAGLGAVSMATVFWTPLICQTGLRSSWPVRNRCSTLRP